LEFRFWGVRGSYPVARPHASRLGGNTPCVQVQAGGRQIIIDAGTGIRRLGQALMAGGACPPPISLLISHTHWDHIQGFPHFAPAYDARGHIAVWSLRRPQSLAGLFSGQQELDFFPVPLERLPCRLEFFDLQEGEAVDIGPVLVRARRLNHAGVTSGYRLQHEGGVLAYICDVAPSRDMLLADIDTRGDERRTLDRLFQNQLALADRAEVVIYDTFFTPEEYQERRHWGHSTAEDAVEVCRRAGARNLFLFHHNPDRPDEAAERLLESLRQRFQDADLAIHAAVEGQSWRIRPGEIERCE
jgi:phosphoribosyl 1,2-cyclic phosphodiesterase